MEFTKEQWAAEMAEAKANGCEVMDYAQWVEYRQLLADLFNEVAA